MVLGLNWEDDAANMDLTDENLIFKPAMKALLGQKKATQMNKYTQKLLLLFAAISLLFLARAITPTIIDKNGEIDSQIKISTELKNVSQAEIDGIKKEVLVALISIPQILGIEYKKNTKIKIIDSDICYASGDIVSLAISHIRDNSAPIIHEVTHILTKHEHNSFFTEGLAVYFQERFGGNNSFPNFSASLDELVRNQEDQLLQITQL